MTPSVLTMAPLSARMDGGASRAGIKMGCGCVVACDVEVSNENSRLCHFNPATRGSVTTLTDKGVSFIRFCTLFFHNVNDAMRRRQSPAVNVAVVRRCSSSNVCPPSLPPLFKVNSYFSVTSLAHVCSGRVTNVCVFGHPIPSSIRVRMRHCDDCITYCQVSC